MQYVKLCRSKMEIAKLISRRSTVFTSGVQHLLSQTEQGSAKFAPDHEKKLPIFQEIKVPVPWGHIAAKACGPEDGVPVLAVHGWQDNAGSFDGLAPLFPSNVRLVSVDLSGHGLSSHRSPGSFYSLHEFISDLLRVMDFLRWDRTSFIAHSLGSFVILHLSWLFPERVAKVIGLDGFCPDRSINVFRKEQMMQYFLKERVMESRRREDAGSYEPEEACEQLIATSGGVLSQSSARTLLIRGAFPCGLGNRLKFSRDPRIRYSLSLISCHDYEMFENAANTFNKPLLLFFGNDSSYEFCRDPSGHYRQTYGKNCSYFKYVFVEGNHYAHLNDPQQYQTHIVHFMNMEP